MKDFGTILIALRREPFQERVHEPPRGLRRRSRPTVVVADNPFNTSVGTAFAIASVAEGGIRRPSIILSADLIRIPTRGHQACARPPALRGHAREGCTGEGRRPRAKARRRCHGQVAATMIAATTVKPNTTQRANAQAAKAPTARVVFLAKSKTCERLSIIAPPRSFRRWWATRQPW